MSNLKCTECPFYGSYYDKENQCKRFACFNKLTYKKDVAMASIIGNCVPSDVNAPKWCPIRKTEWNVVGTLWDVCNALDKHKTIIDFSLLEHSEIK